MMNTVKDGRPLQAERHTAILEALRETKVVRVEELATELGVSVATVRRDLKQLGSQGAVNRLFGGATGPSPDLSFAPRSQTRVAEKARIAQLAITLIRQGDAVALDTGTTVTAVASSLRDAVQVTVLTNSVEVMLALQASSSIGLMMSGGMFDAVTRSLQGPLVESFYAESRADTFIMGAGSLSPEGVRDSHVLAFPGKRAALRAADRTIVVADSSKFSRSAVGQVADWAEVAVLITDTAAPADALAAIRAQGVQVLQA
jgi:DeoR/GlpR family transcriptional regulator of sugar metabolism